jgi:hypothetical protein
MDEVLSHKTFEGFTHAMFTEVLYIAPSDCTVEMF